MRGARPEQMARLAEQIGAALDDPADVNPDSPPRLLRSLHRAGRAGRLDITLGPLPR